MDFPMFFTVFSWFSGFSQIFHMFSPCFSPFISPSPHWRPRLGGSAWPSRCPTCPAGSMTPRSQSANVLSMISFSMKPWFLPLDMGVSCNFFLKPIQWMEYYRNTMEYYEIWHFPWTFSMNITESLVLEYYRNIMEIRCILLWKYHEIPLFHQQISIGDWKNWSPIEDWGLQHWNSIGTGDFPKIWDFTISSIGESDFP